MPRNIAPRQAPAYNSKAHGGSEMGGMPGDYTLNRDVARVYSTAPGFKEGPTWFRPFPMLSYEDPQNMLQPGRLAAEPGNYSHWHVQIRAAEFLGIKGDEQCTFLLYQPGDEEGKAANPYLFFYRACNKAHDSSLFGNGKKWDSSWNKLIKSTSRNDFQAIVKPSKVCFMQGALYKSGDRDYMAGERATGKPFGLAHKDPLVVMRLKASGTTAMLDLFDRLKKEYEGDTDANTSLPFVFGDPVGRFLPKKRVLTGGKIMEFYNPKLFKQQGDNYSWDGTIANFQGYECGLHDEYEGNSPRFEGEDVDQIFEKVQFWFGDGGDKGLLRFASPEEQAVWIARAFKSVPRLVRWVFEERDELLTDDVKGVLASRTSSVPAADDGDDDDDQPVKTKKKVVVDEDDGDDAPPPAKKTKTDPTVAKKKPVVEEEEEDEEDADAEAAAEEEAGEVDDSDPEEGEEEEEAAPVVKKKKPVVEEEEEEEPAPVVKKKKPVVEEEEEEEEPAPVVKKKKPVVEEEEEEEAPAPAPKKKAAAPVEEEEEEEPAPVVKKKKVVVEEEEEEPAPVVKKKKPVVEEEEEDETPPAKVVKKKPVVEEEEEEETPAPKVVKKKAAPVEEEEEEEAPAPKKKKPVVEEEEEDEAPAPKKKKPAAPVEEEDEDYFAQGGPAKSLKAAKEAGERSDKRSVAAKPAPAAPKTAAAKPKKK